MSTTQLTERPPDTGPAAEPRPATGAAAAGPAGVFRPPPPMSEPGRPAGAGGGPAG